MDENSITTTTSPFALINRAGSGNNGPRTPARLLTIPNCPSDSLLKNDFSWKKQPPTPLLFLPKYWDFMGYIRTSRWLNHPLLTWIVLTATMPFAFNDFINTFQISEWITWPSIDFVILEGLISYSDRNAGSDHCFWKAYSVAVNGKVLFGDDRCDRCQQNNIPCIICPGGKSSGSRFSCRKTCASCILNGSACSISAGTFTALYAKGIRWTQLLENTANTFVYHIKGWVVESLLCRTQEMEQDGGRTCFYHRCGFWRYPFASHFEFRSNDNIAENEAVEFNRINPHSSYSPRRFDDDLYAFGPDQSDHPKPRKSRAADMPSSSTPRSTKRKRTSRSPSQRSRGAREDEGCVVSYQGGSDGKKEIVVIQKKQCRGVSNHLNPPASRPGGPAPKILGQTVLGAAPATINAKGSPIDLDDLICCLEKNAEQIRLIVEPFAEQNRLSNERVAEQNRLWIEQFTEQNNILLDVRDRVISCERFIAGDPPIEALAATVESLEDIELALTQKQQEINYILGTRPIETATLELIMDEIEGLVKSEAAGGCSRGGAA